MECSGVILTLAAPAFQGPASGSAARAATGVSSSMKQAYFINAPRMSARLATLRRSIRTLLRSVANREIDRVAELLARLREQAVQPGELVGVTRLGGKVVDFVRVVGQVEQLH